MHIQIVYLLPTYIETISSKICPSFRSISVTKYSDQKQLQTRGRKSLFPLTNYNPSLREVRAGAQAKT